MSSYDQHQAPAPVSPPAPSSAVEAPPIGYPVSGDAPESQQAPVETKSRGDDGFWKGCCAALCCCCVLETCC